MKKFDGENLHKMVIIDSKIRALIFELADDKIFFKDRYAIAQDFVNTIIEVSRSGEYEGFAENLSKEGADGHFVEQNNRATDIISRVMSGR